ncbi:hypothetical protein [Hymenobacter sp. UYCo722]|uniref:hypothetical protein n=1 Tax=Hymenobacter sp. UYCo722 TaxID=3156335 RepID=UPI003399F3C1
MSCLAATFAALLLAPGGGPGASARPAVTVRVSSRSCLVGHPVTLTLQTTQPPGTTIRWNLVDEKIAADTAVAILQVSTHALGHATMRHDVVFTRAQSGTYDSGRLCALLARGNAVPDTLVVPGVRLRFQPEAPRFGLHPLRPVMSAQQAGLLSKTGVLALATLVLGTGGALWLASRQAKNRERRAGELRAPAPTRQQTLLAMEELERQLAAGSQASRTTPEHLYRILTAYLAQEQADNEPVSAPEVRAPRTLVTEPDRAGRAGFNGLLNELSRIRFAPHRWGTDALPGLLARARELVGADETTTLPEKP